MPLQTVEGIGLCQQHPNTAVRMKEFFECEPFYRIIELGTGAGCFTMFLRKHCYTVWSMDKIDRTIVDMKDVFVRRIDIFSKSGKETVKDIISAPGRTLLICDNGNKRKEVKTFAPSLKLDDLILVHDYPCPDWPAVEFTDADVPSFLESYKDMSDIAYFCGRRKHVGSQ